MHLSEINNAFLRLSNSGKAKELEQLLEASNGLRSGLNVNHTSPQDGTTALIQCVIGAKPYSTTDKALGDFKACIRLLGKHGVKVDHQDQKGRSALHWSMVCNSREVAAELVQLRADPTLEDKEGHTAVEVALRHGRFDCLSALVKRSRRKV